MTKTRTVLGLGRRKDRAEAQATESPFDSGNTIQIEGRLQVGRVVVAMNDAPRASMVFFDVLDLDGEDSLSRRVSSLHGCRVRVTVEALPNDSQG